MLLSKVAAFHRGRSLFQCKCLLANGAGVRAAFIQSPAACIHPKINQVLDSPFKYVQPFELNTKEKEPPSR